MATFRNHVFAALIMNTLLVVSSVLGKLKCDLSHPSGLQWDVFYGRSYNVVSEFCKQQAQDEANALSWKVDINGNRQQPAMEERSPPITPNTYKNYQVNLVWTPHRDFVSGLCPQSCLQTYQDIAQSHCGHTGGESNIMAKNGTSDIGCGQYSWFITEAARPSLTLSYEPSQPIPTEDTSSRTATKTFM
ncbi:hypothetical protein LY78DRAFT_669487 [Colletotrichum sublineola]|nr:hypothetical protein LY78DRAFT_669487 [Colletotrichum sublineola]